ncbi:class I adenylate-forming enzyme family protein [Mycolicibacterium hodleri]|uniref:Long-chain-fatty-acid--CoA ligase FadD13 n=1 Tax=Mycolicibacterium hodleri TaxID=49897 RepID=A0A502E624_9MYCO|nr:AMP-binding protein [Mycolicibacterium hodleri]TPG32409.1 o-succinylbenzoate--CoA ligase [Mycolicibacterium hodleri]
MPTIGGTALLNARRVGHREAVVTADRRWTWGELDVAIGDVAAKLQNLGLKKGDRLAILSTNSPEFIIALNAASRLGGIVVPVNTRLAAPELAHILADSGTSVLAFAPNEIDLATSAADPHHGVVLAALGPNAEHPDLMAGGERNPVHDDRATESDDAFILYTSGTTGKPKGSLMDHHRAVWAAMSQIVSLGLRDGDRYLHLAPMYHSGGVTFLNATTLLGGTHIVVPKFDPRSVLEMVERFSATWLFGVPTMYQQLLRLDDARSRDTSSWRVGVFGAAPMPPVAVETLLTTFPGVEFFQQCGQTEAGPTGIYSTMEQVRSQPDSSGHVAQPFMEARVVDSDGADTVPGSIGELIFRGEAVTKGYWRQPDATAETIRDGWLHTGDLMHISDDGAMRLVDRLKDVIISGGRNVYSAEVEQAIAQHDDVADVAVIGRPDLEWGATVVAVVTAVEGSDLTEAAVRQHCRSRIADFKIPREVIFGVVPRNATGKLQKQVLRKAIV